MKTNDDYSEDVPRSASSDRTPPRHDPVREAADRWKAELDTTWSAIRRAAYVEKQAFGLKVVDGAFQGAVLLCVGVSVLALAVAATYLLVTSLRRGLALWTEGAWWSDLVLAVAIGATIAVAAYLVRRSIHRAALSKTRRKLAAMAPGMRGDYHAAANRNGVAAGSRPGVAT